MPARAEPDRLVFWLLGTLLLVLMTVFGISHALLLDRIDSQERRIERLENKEINRNNGKDSS